ncbi:MAG: hypothetical protein ACK4M4_07770, partial [Flavobacterium sp.]
MNSKYRKAIHLFLFISIIVLQVVAFKFWYSEMNVQNDLYQSIDKIAKPNQALTLSNQATKSYFEANNAFATYLNTTTAADFKEYQLSLQKMTADLQQLSALTTTDAVFKDIIDKKVGAETKLSVLKAELDQIINTNFNAVKKLQDIDFKVKAYDYEKVLSSITYDTTKTATVTKKKGLFGRIGNALSGKNQVDKEEVKSVIKMVFNNQEKSGSFEEQLSNIFRVTENHYKTEINKLKKVQSNIKAKDKQLLLINKTLLAKSQEIVLLYSSSAQELNKLEYIKSVEDYKDSLKNKKQLIIVLLTAIALVTVLLLIYTINS